MTLFFLIGFKKSTFLIFSCMLWWKIGTTHLSPWACYSFQRTHDWFVSKLHSTLCFYAPNVYNFKYLKSIVASLCASRKQSIKFHGGGLSCEGSNRRISWGNGAEDRVSSFLIIGISMGQRWLHKKGTNIWGRILRDGRSGSSTFQDIDASGLMGTLRFRWGDAICRQEDGSQVEGFQKWGN